MSDVVDGHVLVADSERQVRMAAFDGVDIAIIAAQSGALVGDLVGLSLLTPQLGYVSGDRIVAIERNNDKLETTGAEGRDGGKAMAPGGTFLMVGAGDFRGTPLPGLYGIVGNLPFDLRKRGPITQLVNGPAVMSVHGARVIAVNAETGLDIIQMGR
jgi:hypothetical protein